MDTPTITQYYRESDPARRLALLNMSIEAGEEPELNQGALGHPLSGSV